MTDDVARMLHPDKIASIRRVVSEFVTIAPPGMCCDVEQFAAQTGVSR